jgi:hypothetical protein
MMDMAAAASKDVFSSEAAASFVVIFWRQRAENSILFFSASFFHIGSG